MITNAYMMYACHLCGSYEDLPSVTYACTCTATPIAHEAVASQA